MIGSTEGLLILLVVLVLFGGTQVPKLAKALGSSVNSFKKGLKEGEEAELETALKTVSVYEKKEPATNAAVKVEGQVAPTPKKRGRKPGSKNKTTKAAKAKTAVKKTTVKKTTAKKTAAKVTVKKAPAKKTAAKAIAKKAPVKKTATKKTATKKAAS